MFYEESKQYSYNGQLYIQLSPNQFTFHPTNSIDQLCVFYDISGYEYEKKLFMKMKRSSEGPSVITITLCLLHKSLETEDVLMIYLRTPAIMMDTFKDEYEVFKKSLQMFGRYHLSCGERTVQGKFKHHDGSQYSIVVNANTKIYDAYNWLCKVWPLRCECTEYCISTKEGGLCNEGRTFLSFGESRKVKFKVAERCYIYSISEPIKTFVIPWNKNGLVLLRCIAHLLGMNEDEVRLLNKDHEVIRGNQKLDIDSFRETEMKNPPKFWYDVSKKIMKCRFMGSKNEFVNVNILRDCTVVEIKNKLHKELNIDWKRFIVSQKKKLLVNEDIVSPEEDVVYYIGSTLDDILSKDLVGEGSFGKVYKCTLKSYDKAIALKHFKIPISDDNKRISLIREIVIMSQVPVHKNLVRYLDIYVEDTDIYIGMEYMEMRSLRKYLDVKKGLSEREIKNFCRDILEGLDHLHKNDVNHRDIKGDNVLLDANYVAKLCDFGISKILTDTSSQGAIKNLNPTIGVGTVRYMAPEIINSSNLEIMKSINYEFKADIWSFGATVVEMITGYPPYPDKDDAYVLNKVGKEKVIIFEASMSKSLENFVKCCLDPDPKCRPMAHELLLSEFMKH